MCMCACDIYIMYYVWPLVQNKCSAAPVTNTKWVDAILLPNQKAVTTTKALINLFSTMGLPDIVHSDQGQNFESTIL